MSNKPLDKLNPIDLDLRLTSSIGMEEGIKQIIIRHCGFELYNDRPYHNYETWSDGYIIIGRKDKKAMSKTEAAKILLGEIHVKWDDEIYIKVSREDLDEAVNEFTSKIFDKEELKKRRINVMRWGVNKRGR